MEEAGKIQTTIGRGKIWFAHARAKAQQEAGKHVAEAAQL